MFANKFAHSCPLIDNVFGVFQDFCCGQKYIGNLRVAEKSFAICFFSTQKNIFSFFSISHILGLYNILVLGINLGEKYVL